MRILLFKQTSFFRRPIGAMGSWKTSRARGSTWLGYNFDSRI